ncbi:protein arginine kinase [Paenisporosarcina cavernae]|uniref:Protein-arginine kinase n=1 Tax=Paenisporosarcina cavernae TaxID=2320858 RepID=A0A385YZ59_9BACL|nr:protein arginine kinase [Paenisporosarcina cavernae]AYC30642.1 protein arginine kinase [Paenisporosarcina cavernae]
MTIEKFLESSVSGWMDPRGEDSDIVMSTRIRLARNLRGYRFPLSFTENEAHQVDQLVTAALVDSAEKVGTTFSSIPMEKTTTLDRQILVEKHLISPNLAKGQIPGSVLLSEDEGISVMVNEEDHIRIQCLFPGLQLEEAYEQADTIDRIFEKELPYAFDEEFGYLTSCPTNTGTGLRASVMMHLPALTMTNQMGRIIQAIMRVGMVVRGIYGEGSEALGNVYQVSNQTTLGKTEEEILEDLQSITEQIIQKEREARETLLHSEQPVLADTLYRSLGVLTYARIISTDEAAKCLSDVRLGIDLGIITGVDVSILNECMIFMQPGFIQKYAGNSLQPNERDVFRAKMIRERLTIENKTTTKGEKPHDV